jgi:transcriptional regulator of acetoin/glycerol metabolism
MNCILEPLWPGNIRELHNRLSRAELMSESDLIEPDNLGFEVLEARDLCPSKLTMGHARAQAERHAVISSLTLANHNVSAAARQLQISRLSLYRLMQKCDLMQWHRENSRHLNNNLLPGGEYDQFQG